MLKTILGRSCSTLFKNTASVCFTNAVRTCSSSEYYRKRRRAIRKALEERSSKALIAEINNRLYANSPYPDLPYLLSMLGDTFVTFPALSRTMTSGEIFIWQKTEGDIVLPGDVLAEIHTDWKGIKNFETPAVGYLAKRLIKAGQQDVPVGCLLCIIVENKCDVDFYENNLIDIYRIFSRSTMIHFNNKKPKNESDDIINKILS